MFKVDFSQRLGLSGSDSSLQEGVTSCVPIYYGPMLVPSNQTVIVEAILGTAKYEKLDLHLFVSMAVRRTR
jgi:hypothetical protein